jgi:FtsH-binding integral membrane protein
MYARRGQDVEMGYVGNTKDVASAHDDIRRGFVQKVYGLVAVQLAATAALAAPIATASDAWLEEHAGLFVFSTFGFLVLMVVMMCGGQQMLRKHPTNLLFLAGFTLLESVSVGFLCAAYEMESVLLCLGVTAAVAGALTAYAFNTKVDVTGMGGYLRSCSLALFAVGILGLFVRIPMLQLAYAAGGALLISGYLVYDTQLIVGGKTEHKFSIDDYVLAALSLYMDLVRLFMFILRLVGKQRERR